MSQPLPPPPTYRFHPDQRLQILVLPPDHFEAFLQSWTPRFGVKPTAIEVCSMAWNTAKGMDAALAALHKEVFRFWIVRASQQFPAYVCHPMVVHAIGKHGDIFHPSVTLEQLEHLRDLICQHCDATKPSAAATASAPTPERFSIPEDVHEALKMLSYSPHVRPEYTDLVNYYCRLESTATIPCTWKVDFSSKENLRVFVERVEQAERKHWAEVIPIRMRAYPNALWAAFYERVSTHFGGNILNPDWIRMMPIGRVRLAARVLEIRDLDEVNAFLRKDVIATSPVPQMKQDEPDFAMTTMVSSVLPREVREVREVRFLAKLVASSSWMSPMVHYMGCEKKERGIRSIAQMVQENTDSALFDEWEAVVEQRDPQHIVSKVMARRDQARMTFSQQCVLDGLASMDTVGTGDVDSWFKTLLSKWKTLSARQQTLVHAFLDQLNAAPKQEEKK